VNLFFQEAAEKTGKSAETCPPLWNLSLFTQIAQLAFFGQLTYIESEREGFWRWNTSSLLPNSPGISVGIRCLHSVSR
jgi:hypothetical protein